MGSERSKRISEMREQLRKYLFETKTMDHAVHHFPKPGMEQKAIEQWKQTGVCFKCWRWSISAGRCDCGWVSDERKARDEQIKNQEAARVAEIDRQIALEDLRQANLKTKGK